MSKTCIYSVKRRTFIKKSLNCAAFLSLPGVVKLDFARDFAGNSSQDNAIDHIVQEETLFAGIRKPIKKRDELISRIEVLNKACTGKIIGHLTHIFRFDTPVDGYDSEIGYPVSLEINTGDIKTHLLRKMHFYSLVHEVPLKTLSETSSTATQWSVRNEPFITTSVMSALLSCSTESK